MLAIEAILEELVLRIDVVEDGIGVYLVRGGEDYNLERLVRLLQALHEVWPQVDARAYRLLAWEVDLEDHVRVLRLNVVNAVNEGLIHVEDQYFLVLAVQRLWQVDQLVLDGLFTDHRQMVLDEVKSLQRVIEVLPVKIDLLAITIFIGLRISLRYLRHEVIENISLLLFFVLLLSFIHIARILTGLPRHLIATLLLLRV